MRFSFLVDGEYSPWGVWGECSTTCAEGVQNRTRECFGMEHGGTACEGEPSQTRECNERECPGMQVQSVEFVSCITVS